MKPYYDDGGGRVIYHGDAMEILPTLNAASIDLVLTDPPYMLANGKKANTMGNSARRSNGQVLKGTALINRDYGEMPGGDRVFNPLDWLTFPAVILWGAIHYASTLPNATKWLVWDKRDGVKSDDNADCEMAWTSLKGPARIYRHLWKGVCRAGEENIATNGRKLHPFQKPVALMRWCIEQAKLPPQSFILDPFMGSGTTLRAAKDNGCRAVGIELEEKYCAIAARRLEQGVLEFSE